MKELSALLEKLRAASSLEELQTAEAALFSRKKGALPAAFRELKTFGEEERRARGPELSKFRAEAEALLEKKKRELGGESSQPKKDFFDATLPGKKPATGKIHPLTRYLWEIEDFFSSLGFLVYDGPEADTEFFQFESVNIPKFHPARDMQDTFFLDLPPREGEEGGEWVLRAHTSNCQVRAMREFGAPLRAIVPGRVFRNEERDARHEHTFAQVEGIHIDRGISIANFRAIVEEFCRHFLGAETKVRLRPGFFPFVEPGFELDFSCFCRGEGCGLCKGTGWVEFGGAGMIHPTVLRHGGIDPKEFSGWAFGFGERLLFIRHEIGDCRVLREGKLEFLRQI